MENTSVLLSSESTLEKDTDHSNARKTCCLVTCNKMCIATWSSTSVRPRRWWWTAGGTWSRLPQSSSVRRKCWGWTHTGYLDLASSHHGAKLSVSGAPLYPKASDSTAAMEATVCHLTAHTHRQTPRQTQTQIICCTCQSHDCLLNLLLPITPCHFISTLATLTCYFSTVVLTPSLFYFILFLCIHFLIYYLLSIYFNLCLAILFILATLSLNFPSGNNSRILSYLIYSKYEHLRLWWFVILVILENISTKKKKRISISPRTGGCRPHDNENFSSSFLSPFLVLWFPSAEPPLLIRPLTLPSSLLLSIFSRQTLAEIALFESEYVSSAGPTTKLEPLHCVSSYVWHLHEHWPLSLSIPRLESVQTWSVLLLYFFFFLVVFYHKGYLHLDCCVSFDFHMWTYVCHFVWLS